MTTTINAPSEAGRATAGGLPGTGLDVAVFITCINDVMFPQTGIAVTKLLERLGCRVHFPKEQTCCAQITTNTGYFDESMNMVRSYVKGFGDYDYVVSPSGSCTAAVRDQHPMLAQRLGDAGLQRDVAHTSKITYDLPEFLVDVLGVTDVGAYFPHRVTYHPSCHGLRLIKLGQRPYDLLKNVRGMTLVDLPAAEQCCGFGGTFCVKNYDMSATMAGDKARHVRETGAEYVVGGDNSCLLNIGGVLARENSGVKAIHLAEVLANTEED
ncbi:L-lactate dehydrogenase complex protein LldE [Propionibacterium cyclohexanicum]|uniref:L-lactate dehydrogenase complex protein LldE n=1 Tax=Propionibacterium cyclohexanicum TaxID=64702 RepID=A0A1H9SW67_9ACTN|nr:(Fe-S)-binding protein [Propionibacterium cyclohexanicum]SER89146.1 L-lactate dehydrogenase complex protein LldE [Propionibacterium cyclohexanicum]